MSTLSEIPSKIQDTLAILKENEARLKRKMELELDFDSKVADAANKLAASISALSREGRAWHGKVEKSISDMSLKDRMDVAVQFIQRLSLGDRKKLYDRLESEECGRKDRVRIIVG